jgi:predicted TIM-barrel fold metal-dependent hydrolase
VLPVLPTSSPEAAAREVERAARAGHRGALLFVHDIECGDPRWDRLWAAVQASDLPLSFHIGAGTRVKPRQSSWQVIAFSSVAPIQLDEPLAAMIFSGALERHPRMKLVLAESGIGWLPYFIARMDEAARKYKGHARDYQLRALPGEIFRRQVLATFEEEPLGAQLMPLLGAGSFMWASDYPHTDSTFPHSRAAIARELRPLSPQDRRKVTSDNCRALYRFD